MVSDFRSKPSPYWTRRKDAIGDKSTLTVTIYQQQARLGQTTPEPSLRIC